MVGSFLNVCIWRLPAEEQVVKGRSHCRKCGKIIRWYDNVPLVSFALLGGRCRDCKSRISWSYPAVELATGLLFLGTIARFGWTWLAAIYAVVGASLIVVSVVDAREMIIPDEITIPGMRLGVILSFFVPALHRSDRMMLSLLKWRLDPRWEGLIASVVGAVVGAGFLVVIGAVGSRIFKREAMGGGDVKLMAMVGSLIGAPKALLVNLVVAPVLGSAVGLFLRFRYKKELIPYGPFLSIGSIIAIFWGDSIVAWYRQLFFL